MDCQSLLLPLASNADSHFVHFTLVVLFSLLSLFRLFLVLLISEVGGSLHVGEKSHLIGADSLAQFYEHVFPFEGPSLLLEALDVFCEIGDVFFFSLDLIFDDFAIRIRFPVSGGLKKRTTEPTTSDRSTTHATKPDRHHGMAAVLVDSQCFANSIPNNCPGTPAQLFSETSPASE